MISDLLFYMGLLILIPCHDELPLHHSAFTSLALGTLRFSWERVDTSASFISSLVKPTFLVGGAGPQNFRERQSCTFR